MALQFGEVVEWVGSVELAGMNNAHIKIAHAGAVQGLVEQRVFAAMETFP